MADPARDLDLVLFGATGFTGGLTADYLAAHAPDGLRWAIAGRNADKLEAVRRRLGVDGRRRRCWSPTRPTSPPCRDVARRAARRHHHDRPLPRVRRARSSPPAPRPAPTTSTSPASRSSSTGCTSTHHQTAVRTGARIVHACGFDSIPHDLGAYFTVQQLPDDEPITMRGVVRSGGTFSGGTFHSALDQFARAKQMRAAYAARRRAEAATRGPVVARGRAASRTATRCSATGCSRCRPSTRSSWRAAAPRWRRTARSSATPTGPAPRRCATPPAVPPRSGR